MFRRASQKAVVFYYVIDSKCTSWLLNFLSSFQVTISKCLYAKKSLLKTIWSTVFTIFSVVFVNWYVLKASTRVCLAFLLGQGWPENVVFKSPAKQTFLLGNIFSKSESCPINLSSVLNFSSESN
jgi:hypothetical protein